MGIYKPILLLNGELAEYHKIAHAIIHPVNGAAMIHVQTFKTQADRNAKGLFVNITQVIMPPGSITASFLDGRELMPALYGHVKTLDKFSGGQDV